MSLGIHFPYLLRWTISIRCRNSSTGCIKHKEKGECMNCWTFPTLNATFFSGMGCMTIWWPFLYICRLSRIWTIQKHINHYSSGVTKCLEQFTDIEHMNLSCLNDIETQKVRLYKHFASPKELVNKPEWGWNKMVYVCSLDTSSLVLV